MPEQEILGSEQAESPAAEPEVVNEQGSTASEPTAVENVADINQFTKPLPEYNRQREQERFKDKYFDTQQKLDDALQRLERLEQGGQKSKWTIEELEEVAAKSDDASIRVAALREIRKIEKDAASTDASTAVRSELDRWKREQQVDGIRQQSLNVVMQYYPDAFAKDQAGRVVGWNNNNPLTQRIGQYMQDPEIANNPRGLQVAAALAFSDISRGNVVKTQKQVTQMKSEIKSLQKKTLVEGGGSPTPPPKTPYREAIDKTRSGSLKDGASAFKEILKKQGVLPSSE